MRSAPAVAAALLLAAGAAQAQTERAPYGAPITLEQARQVAMAAEAEGRRAGLALAFAIVEPSGQLVHFHRMDGANYSATEIAMDKARSAALFRLPTKFWADQASAANGAWVMGLRHTVPVDGGVTIVIAGRTVGAIGVSGASSAQDAVAARAGAGAVSAAREP